MLVFVENSDNEDSNSENYFDTPIEATLLSKIYKSNAIKEKEYIDQECALKKEIVELKMKCAILEERNRSVPVTNL
jgi:hypothetical protein